MRTLVAFTKKEFLEQIRSGKALILGALFILFGIMNPTIAKLTPWLLDMMSESLAESGMTVTVVEITALDSWVQFFKNIPMALVVFVLLEATIFTKEYVSRTLILSLTKGLERYKVVVSKAIVLLVMWTVGYFVCFGVTYGYNAYFWDNLIAKNLGFSIVCQWLFGVFIISLVTLFSILAESVSGVLVGTGGVVFALYLAGIVPKISKFLPTFITDGNSLIYGTAEVKSYIASVVITALVSVICFAVSVPLFNKKPL